MTHKAIQAQKKRKFFEESAKLFLTRGRGGARRPLGYAAGISDRDVERFAMLQNPRYGLHAQHIVQEGGYILPMLPNRVLRYKENYTGTDRPEPPWQTNNYSLTSDELYEKTLQEMQDDNQPGEKMGPFRRGELQALRYRGLYQYAHGHVDLAYPADNEHTYEVAYAYMGIDVLNAYSGARWLTHYFAISDLRAYAYSIGWVVEMIGVCAEMLVNSLHISGRVRAIVTIMGNGDPTGDIEDVKYFTLFSHRADSNDDELVYEGRKAFTLDSLQERSLDIFNQFSRFFEGNGREGSDSNYDFNMRRIYITILREKIGGDAEELPDYLLKLREQFFESCPRYKKIDNSADQSCGVQALLHGLMAANRSVLNVIKKDSSLQLVPINTELEKLRKKTARKLYQKEQFQHEELFLVLARLVDWKEGVPLEPIQLANGIKTFNAKYNVNFGVLIFDASRRSATPYVSYDRIPGAVPYQENMICLIHFSHEGGGHYDMVSRSSLVAWIRGTANHKLNYDFLMLRCISRYVLPKSGKQCDHCFFPEPKVGPLEWEKGHFGTQWNNKLQCRDCLVKFKSIDCYKQHLLAKKTVVRACDRQRLCDQCHKVHLLNYDCLTKYCRVCYIRYPVNEEHICFFQFLNESKAGICGDVIYCDIESQKIEAGRKVQQAITIAARWFNNCGEHDDCLTCGGNALTMCVECKTCTECKWQDKYIEGHDCLIKYLNWLFEEHIGATCVFHNGGKYDFHLLSQAICSDRQFTKHDVMRGNKILYMQCSKDSNTEHEQKTRKTSISFIDSLNFITKPLSHMPKMFDLETIKGHFPFGILDGQDLDQFDGKIPREDKFGYTELEIKSDIKDLNPARQEELKELRKFIAEWDEKVELKGEKWNAKEQLRLYNKADVKLLQEACDAFRRSFRECVGTDPFLWVTLPSAVASAYRQPQFMPENSIQIFKMPEREWQRKALRGGRTEAFKLYYRAKPGQKIMFVDINSSYPFQQSYGFFPIGRVDIDINFPKGHDVDRVAQHLFASFNFNLFDLLLDPTGRHGCGIIECDWIECARSFIPTLPMKTLVGKTEKLLFQNKSGPWIGFISVLAEAIKLNQVVVRSIKRLQIWKNTSDQLFQPFLLPLYAKKVEATGWKKLIPGGVCSGPDSKEAKEYILEAKKRGLDIDIDKVKENSALRESSKLINNCGWGYICQKPSKEETVYFENESDEAATKMGEFMESLETDLNPRRMVGRPIEIGTRTKIRTTMLTPLDIEEKDKAKNIAYQVGGQVPAYGQQQLARAMNSLDPSQLLYCDTDSIMYAYDEKDPRHKLIPTGPYLGDFNDEFPGKKITEFVCLGPKTYSVKVESSDGSVFYKTKFKGLPMCRGSFSLLTEDGKLAGVQMNEMKYLLQEALLLKKAKREGIEDIDELVYHFHFTNVFKRNSDFQISQQEEKKSLRFTFDKREVAVPLDFKSLDEVWEINTAPFGDDFPTYDQEGVRNFWAKKKDFFVEKDVIEERMCANLSNKEPYLI